MFNPHSKALHWFILFLLTLVWGSSFILMKKGLEVFPSNQVGALRITITFLFLLPFCYFYRKEVQKKHWKYLTLVGFVGNFFPAFLFAEAQTGIDSSLAGILNSLSPLFTLLVGVLFFKSKARWLNVAGIIIGLVGACGLIYVSGTKGFDNNFGYGIYVIIATFLYALNLNFVKSFFHEMNPIAITAFAFVPIGLVSTSYLFTTNFVDIIETTNQAYQSLLYISILAVVGSALSLFAYYYLIKYSTVLFAASVTYTIPIVAILWGVVDGEIFKPVFLLWMFLILIGVFLVNKKVSSGTKL